MLKELYFTLLHCVLFMAVSLCIADPEQSYSSPAYMLFQANSFDTQGEKDQSQQFKRIKTVKESNSTIRLDTVQVHLF